jgi:alpha-tubulin suppressor-like RCC1 family protein
MTRDAAVALAALGCAACSELPGGADVVAHITLSTSEVALALGDTAALEATVTAGDGRPIPSPTVHWASNDPQVVVVTDGVLAAVGAGATTVTAESGGSSAGATVVVRADLVQVSAGGGHTCSLVAGGRVACWGTNGFGQLGNGTIFARAAPVLVRGPEDATAVVAGAAHACGLQPSGAVQCWGWNWSGQLGIGEADLARHDLPAPVSGGLRFASLTAGERHTCGLDTNGAAYCWGGGIYGQLGTETPQTFCDALAEPCNLQPAPVAASIEFAQLSAGREHTCGVTPSGEGYCWGLNFLGQLGDSTTGDRSVPVKVRSEMPFTMIAAGALHTCGLDVDGRAYCWGTNFQGRLGVSDTLRQSLVPVAVTGTVRFTMLSAGEEHTCGIATNRVVWCWGYNARGQLGVAGELRLDRPAQTNGPRLLSLTAGESHNCGRAEDGKIYCWGSNVFGQLGTGGISRPTAVAVIGQ